MSTRLGVAAILGALTSGLSAASVPLRSGEVGEIRSGVGLRAPSLFDRLGPFSSPLFGYRTGPGFTAAHVKRMAKKRRNQQRHKKACRASAAFR